MPSTEPVHLGPSCQATRAHPAPLRAGIANATTGGWGNLGGGVTQLIMPLIFEGIKNGKEPFEAWRWAMFVPGFLHILAGIGILFFSTDLPDGNYAMLKKAGNMAKDSGAKMIINAISNYRCALQPMRHSVQPCLHRRAPGAVADRPVRRAGRGCSPFRTASASASSSR